MYDITDFVEAHPGGSARIMLAAGSSVDKFWSMYAQHQKKEVVNLLESYRIGSLVCTSSPGPAPPTPRLRGAGGLLAPGTAHNATMR